MAVLRKRGQSQTCLQGMPDQSRWATSSYAQVCHLDIEKVKVLPLEFQNSSLLYVFSLPAQILEKVPSKLGGDFANNSIVSIYLRIVDIISKSN